MAQMISVEEAVEQVLAAVPSVGSERIPLKEAYRRVLREEIRAPIDTPPFDVSAMDGYALRAADLDGEGGLRVIGEVAAGASSLPELGEGQAARIFTGAPIPPGADAVLIQEEARREGERLFPQAHLELGANIRRRGEALAAGAIALPAGERLNAAAVGLLASLGIAEVEVGRLPKVSVISTGSELAPPGAPLGPGQIYESNSPMLAAALRELGIEAASPGSAVDEEGSLKAAIAAALDASSFLLLTGGVSVGDYDLVRKVLPELGVRELFWKVRQKPGKPIYVGLLDREGEAPKMIFGLPGNPSSALSCFYLYVRPALLAAMGARAPRLPTWRLPLAEAVRKREGRAHLLRVRIEATEAGPKLRSLRAQGSHVLLSFAQAQALAQIDEEVEVAAEGSPTLAYLLPD